MQLTILDQDTFISILQSSHIQGELDFDFMYRVYVKSCEIISEAKETSLLSHIGSLSPIEHLFYTFGECLYSRRTLGEEYEKKREEEEYVNQLATMISDKTLSLYFFQYREPRFGNKYLPTISTLEVYLNYFLNTLSSLSKKDPRSSLVVDLLKKSVKLAHTALELLAQGHETEAFSNWRTLHECECTLVLLDRYSSPLIDSYIRHMEYGIAYRGGYSKEKGDEIFVEIKEKMKAHNYKSKDMKKMIEYGWLYDIPDLQLEKDETLRLNFRDGVEKLAGLSAYAKRYELSSEVVHSTPLLIYSDDLYFFYLTLLSVYESFFRLEQVFLSIFSKKVPKVVMEAYQNFKDVYYRQLVNIHHQQAYYFDLMQKQRAEKRKQNLDEENKKPS